MISISGNALGHWLESGVQDNNNPLIVTSCGFQKLITRNLTRFRANGRADFQMIYLLNGKGYFTVDGHTREVPGGSLVVYSPGQTQHYAYRAEDCPELYWIHFTGFYAGEYLKESGFLGEPVFSIGVSNECTELFEQIIHELQFKRPMFQNMANACFLQLLSAIGRQLLVPIPQGISSPDKFKVVLEKIHENYNRPLSVRELADDCNLSLYRFIHKFKAETGMTATQYITRIRINEARKLLSESSLNVAEVSSIIGYDNPLYFSRVFRKVTGASPSTYKKQSLK